MSKRAGNPIYNLLPDTISQLSKDPTVTPIKFKSIFKFLLSFISKDQQTIALVGKLCQRFAESMDQQQWRDIAYCLTQLPYNLKCLRKIIDGKLKQRERAMHHVIDVVFNIYELPLLQFCFHCHCHVSCLF